MFGKRPHPPRMVIIGYGTVARRHVEALRRAGARIVAGVGGGGETRSRVQRELGVPFFDHLNSVFEKIPFDGAVISSPNDTHCGYALQVLEKDRHVLCEKPMATNVADALRMREAARKSRACLMVALNLRYLGHTRRALEICRSGRLGRIYHVHAEWIRPRGIPGMGRWFTSQARAGGGAMIDSGIHLLDLAWFLAGKPDPAAVSARTFSLYRSDVMNVEDFCSALMRFRDGMTLQIDVAWAAHAPERRCALTLFGTKGGLYWSKAGALCVQGPDGPPDVLSREKGAPVSRMHAHYLDCMNGAECLSPAADGWRLQAMIDAVYRSAEAGRECAVDFAAPAVGSSA